MNQDNINNSGKLASNYQEQIICAYACPSTDFQNTPFTFPNLLDRINNKKDIDYYKRKFIELLEEMESEHGICTSVLIDHSMGEISVKVNY